MTIIEQQQKDLHAPASSNRKRDIDLVKSLAVFCIICIHACGNGYYQPIGSFHWVSTVFWGCLTRAGVPLFLMCSGALMLDPEKSLPLKKLYGKNLLRLILALFFWAAVYGVIRLSISKNLNPAALMQLGKDLLLFRHEQHLYFLHIMLLVYAMLPVTRSFVRTATRRQLEYSLVLWLLFGILHPSLLPYWPFRLLSGIPLQWGLNMTWAAVGYGVLGWYLWNYQPKTKRFLLLLTVLGFGSTFAGTWLLSVKKGAFDSTLLSGMSANVCLLSIGVFGLCLGTKPGRWTEYVSKASFCIYLSHMIFILLFQKLSFPSPSMPCLYSIPLLTVSVLACGFLLYRILRHVPFIKQWLI